MAGFWTGTAGAGGAGGGLPLDQPYQTRPATTITRAAMAAKVPPRVPIIKCSVAESIRRASELPWRLTRTFHTAGGLAAILSELKCGHAKNSGAIVGRGDAMIHARTTKTLLHAMPGGQGQRRRVAFRHIEKERLARRIARAGAK